MLPRAELALPTLVGLADQTKTTKINLQIDWIEQFYDQNLNVGLDGSSTVGVLARIDACYSCRYSIPGLLLVPCGLMCGNESW